MSYIVHVDNSDFFRKVMQAFLSSQGHEYRGFSRGEDALDIILAGNVDCVITGLELIDMSGEDFIKQLAVSCVMVPIIVVTARDNEAQSRHLRDLGVKGIVQKTGSWKNELIVHLASINEENEEMESS